MSTNNICFHCEIKNIASWLTLLTEVMQYAVVKFSDPDKA